MASDPKKLLSILKCARPVLFQNDNEQWPLSLGGTAFVVRFRGRHFVLTAKHVLRDFQFSQFRVQLHPDSNQFIPLTGMYTLRDKDPDDFGRDEDQFDIAVWTTADEHLVPGVFGNAEPYDLRGFDALTVFNPNADYLFCGYPIEGREYDSDRRHMHQTALSGRAQYVRRTPYACLHQVSLVLNDQVSNLDGFSGSPVFQVNQGEGKYSYEAFAGMLVRGTRESAIAYFVEHRRIIELMEYVYARPRDEQGTQPTELPQPTDVEPPQAYGIRRPGSEDER
jgi:hypothetical protein